MDTALRTSPLTAARNGLDVPAIGAVALGFVLTTYLALKGGGFDPIVSGEIGIALSWLLVLGAATAVLSGAGIGRAGWICAGLLAAFAVWAGLSATWSLSAERSVAELGRDATYVAALVLALAVQARVGGRAMLQGVTAAIGLVALLAVLSRLQPSWFPANDVGRAFADNAKRLNYPLNEWNALAVLVAMGLPVMLAFALQARTIAGQAVAAAAIPVMALCVFLTVSRGGLLAALVATCVLVALSSDRLGLLLTGVPTGLGALVMIGAVAHRGALRDGADSTLAHTQGSHVLWILVVTCVGVALLHGALATWLHHGTRPAWLSPSRRTTIALTAVLLVFVAVGGVAAGVPDRVSDSWSSFRNPDAPERGASGSVVGRLETSGGGRYQFWQSSLDQLSDHPLRGAGAGTFELYWAKAPTFDIGYVRHAHSLFFGTLGELGIVGFLLIAGFFLTVLGAGISRALRAPPERRMLLAGATAAFAAFTVGTVLEIAWEVPAVPIAALMLAAFLLVGPRAGALAREKTPTPSPAKRPRIALAAIAIAALAAIAVPLASASALRDSQDAFQAGDLRGALQDADAAHSAQPYAAAPVLQRALVLEASGNLAGAREQALVATRKGSADWRSWLVLARIEARLGNAEQAVKAFQRGRALNPQASFFQIRR